MARTVSAALALAVILLVASDKGVFARDQVDVAGLPIEVRR